MDPNDKTQSSTDDPVNNTSPRVMPGVNEAPSIAQDFVPSTLSSATGADTGQVTPPINKNNFLNSKKTKLIALAAGLVIVLGGGGAAAYYGVVVPNQPQTIVKQALTNTINQDNVKSAYFEGEIKLSGDDIEKTISGITFEGARNDVGAIDLKVSANTAVTKVNLDVRSTDSKTFYLKLSGLIGLEKLLALNTRDDSAYAAVFLPILTQVNDNWYSVDESLVNQAAGSGVSLLNNENKISADDANEVGDIYKKHPFIQVTKELGDEKIHGVDSRHIQAIINKDELVAFIEEVKSNSNESLTLEQKDIDELKKVDFTKYPFDLWISKSDKLITQISTNIEESGITYAFRVALFDVNKAVTVEKPANSQSVLELLGDLSPLMGGGGATDLPLEASSGSL